MLIELPRPRLRWWREATVEGLAARLGFDGHGSVIVLRWHESWRCQARRAADLAYLADLDDLGAAAQPEPARSASCTPAFCTPQHRA